MLNLISGNHNYVCVNNSSCKKTLNKLNVFNNMVFFTKGCLFTFKSLNLRILGKIFRWFFSKRKIKFSLNHSHPNILFFKNSANIVKLTKGKYNSSLLLLQPLFLPRFKFFLNKVRGINIFTKRGLFTNTFYSKKVGKISTYI